MAQSILKESISNYKKSYTDSLEKTAYNITLNTFFGIGEEKNLDKLGHNLLMYKMLRTEYCGLKDYINKKIYGEDLDCLTKRKPLSKLPHKKTLTADCSLNEAVEEICEWNKIEW